MVRLLLELSIEALDRAPRGSNEVVIRSSRGKPPLPCGRVVLEAHDSAVARVPYRDMKILDGMGR